MALERLQKIISRAGLASRRKAEEWIAEGRVSINGHAIRELGTKADTETDHITVDGKPVRPPARLVYIALNKPREYMTTRLDPEGRPTVMELVKKVKEPVYPVGRLDYQSEGLLFLTNDGEFANRLTSTASRIPKTYWVKVQGTPPEQELDKLRHGILLDGRRTLPAGIKLLRTAQRAAERDSRTRATETRAHNGSDQPGANAWYEVVITEGRQNQIRRMFSLIGYRVQKLKRMEIGSFALGDLATGKYRYLAPAEISRVLSQKRAAEAHRPFRLEQKPRKPAFHPRSGPRHGTLQGPRPRSFKTPRESAWKSPQEAPRKERPAGPSGRKPAARFSSRDENRKAPGRPSTVHRKPRLRS